MKLLVTGAWTGAKENIPTLEAMGHEVIFMQWEKDALPCPADWPEGLICANLTDYHPIGCFTNLRFIQLTRAGYDHMDMDYIREHDIEFHRAKGVYNVPMAEFAICGVLQLYKQSRFFYENQKLHKWEKHRGLLELGGKTVAIIGCGDLGRECAKRFKAFDCNIIEVHRDLNSLGEALATADIVVLTIALTNDTRHLIHPTQMKEGSVLVNISRGAVVDEDNLIEALNGHLLGAVLDVFEEEPLGENNPLWNMENVIVTPHNSFVGENNIKRLTDMIGQNIRCLN